MTFWESSATIAGAVCEPYCVLWAGWDEKEQCSASHVSPIRFIKYSIYNKMN